jgi:hypothetical protein
LPVLETHRVLRIARGGRLRQWLGPALRGLAGGRLKARTCRQPVHEQVTRWVRCTGCPLRAGCAYGETVEGGADAPDPTRPLVVAPAYPCPEVGQVGDTIPVRVVFIGPSAARHADAFWEALRIGGADPGLGLGEDRVLFDVLAGQEPDRSEEVLLPTDPAAVPGVLPRVRVVLGGPLILKSRGVDGERRLIERPALGNLLGKWEALAELFRPAGVELPRDLLGRVVEQAAGVPLLSHDFRVVGQVKSSHRTKERWEERGVVGRAEYGPVPAGLLPWLVWAGRLHVGMHRVAGAGGWRVEVVNTE